MHQNLPEGAARDAAAGQQDSGGEQEDEGGAVLLLLPSPLQPLPTARVARQPAAGSKLGAAARQAGGAHHRLPRWQFLLPACGELPLQLLVYSQFF